MKPGGILRLILFALGMVGLCIMVTEPPLYRDYLWLIDIWTGCGFVILLLDLIEPVCKPLKEL